MTSISNPDLTPGKKFWQRKDDGGPVEIMAVAKGWVMFRRPRCVPRVLYYKDFLATHQQVRPAPASPDPSLT